MLMHPPRTAPRLSASPRNARQLANSYAVHRQRAWRGDLAPHALTPTAGSLAMRPLSKGRLAEFLTGLVPELRRRS
jgi:hypothetical protein